MTHDDSTSAAPVVPAVPAVGRRRLLGYLAGTAVGVAAGGGVVAAVATAQNSGPSDPAPAGATVSPYGAHQPGVAQATPAVVEVIALRLLPAAGQAREPDALRRLLRAWTGTIEALTVGRGAPGDTTPWLATSGADLTVTVGLGGRALRGLPAPAGFEPVPAMQHDQLQDRWNGGDLLLKVAGRDGTTVAHAVRRLILDAAPWARLAWRQVGDWNGIAPDGSAQTGRNHFGQVDGSANPQPGSNLFDRTVWIHDGPWAGGTTLVVRRIVMDLPEWDTLTRSEQEISMGRRLDDGTPLTGGAEHDDLDLEAVDASGRRIIAMDAHARRSHPNLNGGARIFRKGLNYVDSSGADGALETGLIFLSFQADLTAQFTRIQQSLDIADQLNEWTIAIGSAEFAILPGFEQGEWLGQSLFGQSLLG